MNLPVTPVLPDSSSLAAAAASSAAGQSALGAKSALSGQTAVDDSSGAPSSFDDVFASVDDNGNQTPSANAKGQVKTGQTSCKGQVKTGQGSDASTASTNADQTASDATPSTTSSAASSATVNGLLSANAAIDALANSQTTSSPNAAPTTDAPHGKRGDHASHKKAANTDDSATGSSTDGSNSSVLTASIPALTIDQMAAALAASASSPSVIQNLNTTSSAQADATSSGDTMTLKNGKGRSVAEVLAQGTPVLNYQVATNASGSIPSSDAKAAASAVVPGATVGSDTSLAAATSTDPDATDATSVVPGSSTASDTPADVASAAPKHRHHSAFANATQNATSASTVLPSGSASTSASPAVALSLNSQTLLPNQTAATVAQQTPTADVATADTSDAAQSATAVSADSNSTASTNSSRGVLAAVNSGKSVAPGATRGTGLTAWQKPVGAAQTAAEKFADTSGRQNGSGGDSSNHSAKSMILAADTKQLAKSATQVGTDTAIGRVPMTSNLHASANLAATSDVFATGSSSATSTTGDTHAIAVSHAAALVHQINEIGEGLWRVDRQSVEVNFNFGDKDHLSVRVEYKDGQVQATFNTSSTELRTAITQAWNSQNSSSNDRSYKMAEPIFNNSSNASFSSSDDASSNSRQFASFQDVTNFAGSPRSRSSSASTVSVPATSSPRSSLRPEVAGHLNAIV